MEILKGGITVLVADRCVDLEYYARLHKIVGSISLPSPFSILLLPPLRLSVSVVSTYPLMENLMEGGGGSPDIGTIADTYQNLWSFSRDGALLLLSSSQSFSFPSRLFLLDSVYLCLSLQFPHTYPFMEILMGGSMALVALIFES